MTKIKACGLTREREIDYVNQYLPDLCCVSPTAAAASPRSGPNS